MIAQLQPHCFQHTAATTHPSHCLQHAAHLLPPVTSDTVRLSVCLQHVASDHYLVSRAKQNAELDKARGRVELTPFHSVEAWFQLLPCSKVRYCHCCHCCHCCYWCAIAAAGELLLLLVKRQWVSLRVCVRLGRKESWC